MKKISKPSFTEFAMYYETYINLINDSSILDQLKTSAKEITALFKSLDEERLMKPYAEGKWSMKDILMHLIDAERVFVYRAMRFARLDKMPVPFFDENEFAQNANANKINTTKLLKEFNACRSLTIAFFNNLTVSQMQVTGIASNFTMSVRACAWIILGHELHHLKIIRERYLSMM
ncbi:DinB family protein [Taibaiella lutea]|uniref:DinB family protein n=1 Tax=Taibaiella lutea TaxID=2608001 RepID=A0A5M6CDI2_9BACT|nr:DinB family protein [Taibaiella lutea]KAA5533234.1 DinB family protein [Taibaiella lutea]